MITHVAEALWKRDIITPTDDTARGLPDWASLVFLLDLIVLFPVLLILGYTLEKVFPVIAIVENENPPAYEPVPAAESIPGVPKPTDASPAALLQTAEGRPVTTSLRATWRLLRSHGGFRALFRGLPCTIAQAVIRMVFIMFFVLFVNVWMGPLGDLIGSLAVVQLNAAWVHIVISPRSPLHFWRRLPPFNHTLRATWKPTILFWLATQIAKGSSYSVMHLFGLSPENLGSQPMTYGFAFRTLAALIISILITIFFIIPSYVLLIRIQASLIPEDQETIIPFDRTFDGKVEPAVVSGRGFATIRDVWTTFSRASWRRIVLVYAKITAISIVSTLVFAVFIFPQIFLLAAYGQKGGDNSPDTDPSKL